MTIERAFRLVHLLDVPEKKRKFWPQFAEVVVDRDGTVADVYQFFERPTEDQQIQALNTYPRHMMFPVDAGVLHSTLPEFTAKVLGTAEFIRKLMKLR